MASAVQSMPNSSKSKPRLRRRFWANLKFLLQTATSWLPAVTFILSALAFCLLGSRISSKPLVEELLLSYEESCRPVPEKLLLTQTNGMRPVKTPAPPRRMNLRSLLMSQRNPTRGESIGENLSLSLVFMPQPIFSDKALNSAFSIGVSKNTGISRRRP